MATKLVVTVPGVKNTFAFNTQINMWETVSQGTDDVGNWKN